jgi:uncharacterized membrane protein
MSLLTIYVTFHSIGLVIWTGMALLLPLVILPTVRAMEGSEQTKIMANITRRYLPWFIIAGLTVGATGWAQTFLLINLFGRSPILYSKHVAVVVLIAVSAYIWFYLARKLSKPQTGAAGLWKLMQIFSWLQLVVSIAVLFLCAWMIT